MQKIDYKKNFREFYAPSAKTVMIVNVPRFNFLKIDGQGDPNTSPEFQIATEALFGTAYSLKFMVKKSELGLDYGVMPLEGLWWADDMESFSVENKSAWKWTLMIMQPDFITEEMVRQAVERTHKKKSNKALSMLRLESYIEGKAAQLLHIGPFSEEGPAVKNIHHFIETSGKQRAGLHHEIYLSDIRRASPEKWKTIIRQPFR